MDFSYFINSKDIREELTGMNRDFLFAIHNVSLISIRILPSQF